MSSIPLTAPLARRAVLLLGAAGAALMLGCSSFDSLFGSPPRAKPKVTDASEEVSGRLRPGDQVQIALDFGVQPGQSVQSFGLSIDENGEIELSLVGRIKAAEFTASELAERIEGNYVPRYYVRCNATVLVAARFFYVGGEVRSPGRFPWIEDTTLLKAINTAAGFTDYANRRKVELIHGKDRHVYDCEEMQRNPSKEVPIRPGDTITVPRSIF